LSIIFIFGIFSRKERNALARIMENDNNSEDRRILHLPNLSEIAFIMHDFESENDAYLDVETGQVVYDLVGGRADDYDTDEEAIEASFLHGPEFDEEDIRRHEQIEEGSLRYLHIEQVDHWLPYQDMKDFVDEVDDPRVQELLAVAIDGKGAFGRFRDVLDRYPKWQEEWFAFKQAKEEFRVKEWLEHEGFTIES